MELVKSSYVSALTNICAKKKIFCDIDVVAIELMDMQPFEDSRQAAKAAVRLIKEHKDSNLPL